MTLPPGLSPHPRRPSYRGPRRSPPGARPRLRQRQPGHAPAVGHQRAARPVGPRQWWLADLARELDMPAATLFGWLKRGWATGRQEASPRHRWIITADNAEVASLASVIGGRDLARRARSAQRLDVHRDHPPRVRSRCGGLPGPGAGRLIQSISIEVR